MTSSKVGDNEAAQKFYAIAIAKYEEALNSDPNNKEARDIISEWVLTVLDSVEYCTDMDPLDWDQQDRLWQTKSLGAEGLRVLSARHSLQTRLWLLLLLSIRSIFGKVSVHVNTCLNLG